MKRHCGVGAATLVGVFLFAVSVLAAQVSFTPRVSVTEEYNDNVDLDRKGKKDDFITTVSPGATLEVLGPLSGIRLSYDPSYSFYADHDEFDSWRHNAFGFIWHNFSRETRIDLADSFLYSKDPLDARDVEDERGNIIARGDDRLRRRSTFYRNVALGRLSHTFGRENSAFLQMRHGLYKYDDEAREDSQEFTPSAGFSYWFSAWTGIEAEAAYTRGLYDEDLTSDFNNYSGRLRLNQRVSQRFGLYGQYYQIYRDYDDSRIRPEVDPDYMVYAPSAGLFYQFDPQTTASFGLGWFYQQIQNGEDEQGPYLAADVNRLWSYGRSTLRTRASSGIDSTDFSSDARGFERYGQIELIGRHDFTREFFGDASLRYRYSDYINSDDDVVDHRYTAEAGLGYRVTRWMTLRLAYQFNKLDSENTTDDYEQHRVYATITLQPEQPWRW